MSWRPIKEYLAYRFKPHKGNASDRALFDAWARGKDIVRFSRTVYHADWLRYLKSGRYAIVPHGVSSEAPPEIDHEVIFKGRDGKCWLTYQPYREPEKLCPLVEEWAVRHGLRALVYGKDSSWYYPGGTCLVVIEVSDAEKDQT